MSAVHGEITKITIAPYRGTTTLEADVKMLVEGQEIRRRWKSPHGSRTSTERWAREKAKSFLTGRAAKREGARARHGRVHLPPFPVLEGPEPAPTPAATGGPGSRAADALLDLLRPPTVLERMSPLLMWLCMVGVKRLCCQRPSAPPSARPRSAPHSATGAGTARWWRCRHGRGVSGPREHRTRSSRARWRTRAAGRAGHGPGPRRAWLSMSRPI
jgi:hypothetical protein